MTPAQCRAARALIDMTQADIAGDVVVTTTLIADYEAGVSAPREADLKAIREALDPSSTLFWGSVQVSA